MDDGAEEDAFGCEEGEDGQGWRGSVCRVARAGKREAEGWWGEDGEGSRASSVSAQSQNQSHPLLRGYLGDWDLSGRCSPLAKMVRMRFRYWCSSWFGSTLWPFTAGLESGRAAVESSTVVDSILEMSSQCHSHSVTVMQMLCSERSLE